MNYQIIKNNNRGKTMLIKSIYAITFIIWAISFFTIASMGGGFGVQAPLCIASTIVIFSVATFVVKRLAEK
jgi:cell division GTPase FtsZ